MQLDSYKNNLEMTSVMQHDLIVYFTIISKIGTFSSVFST